MSLTQPTIAEIDAQIIALLEVSLNKTLSLLPKSFNRVLSKTLAGVFVLLWRYIGFVFLQMFVSTATIKDVEVGGRVISPLKEWGRLIGVGDPTPATQARLTLTVVVDNQTGQLESGTQLVNADNGVTYLSTISVPLITATVEVPVIASGDQTGGTGAGVIGNLSDGAVVSFANPIANVGRDATVLATLETAADAEATEVYRQRILDRFQKRVQGGALADYEIWGEEAAGVINVYPYTGASAGEVDVFAEATVVSSGNADGIPTAAQLLAVLNLIELDAEGVAFRRPANCFVNVAAITRTGFNVDVVGLTVPTNLAQLQADITTELTDYLFERQPFIPGVSLLPRKDSITKNGLIGLVEDLVQAAGGAFRSVNFSLTSGGGNLGTYILGMGETSKATGVVYTP